jgi:hypothetical protein
VDGDEGWRQEQTAVALDGCSGKRRDAAEFFSGWKMARILFESDGKAGDLCDRRSRWVAAIAVSTAGGYKLRWRRDGKELFYVAADGSMMAAKIAVIDGRPAAKPQRLFDANLSCHTNYDANFAVSSVGQRFLAIAKEISSSDVDIQMMLN